MPTKNYSELRSKLTAEQRRAAEAKAQTMLVEIHLAKLRAAAGLTQSQLADEIGVSQPAIAKVEGNDDIGLAALGRYVGGLGYSLEVDAVSPTGERIEIARMMDMAKTSEQGLSTGRSPTRPAGPG
ncbi:helix-turn-helix transcriptional regulator [Roseiconus lacunae]|uniref:helix-turn-helix domain-containing protein n=1 Tax=Roseiconus lacunae TaxID=2605694 RepID=UPI00308EC344|nr:helix-turn-helix transcriptional regulator [Stieleria sp. HD01]